MHCPRCGQQQISNETRFCSRCGFQLGVVSELLLHDGYLPQLAQLEQQGVPISVIISMKRPNCGGIAAPAGISPITMSRIFRRP